MMKRLHEYAEAKQERRKRFGEGRSSIYADYRGYKVVAVGNQLLFSKHWRTFPDFLLDYIKRVLDPAWGNAEIAKPFDERHEIMKWFDGVCRWQQDRQPGSDGGYGFVPNGPTRAYLLLSYDLYTLEHSRALQAAVVKRLKHKDQFQGARHELFAAATCIRAGYEIDYEDESDVTRRHPEFIATHRVTGQKVAVEAKSRHRPGTLGQPGQRAPKDTVRAGIKRLLKGALGKPVSHPYVIFFDLNLPAFERNLLKTPWFTEIGDTVADVGDATGDRDPFNLIVFSNQPDHYGFEDAPPPGGSILSVVGRNPRLTASHPKAIAEIHDAANKFGELPNSFEEA